MHPDGRTQSRARRDLRSFAALAAHLLAPRHHCKRRLRVLPGLRAPPLRPPLSLTGFRAATLPLPCPFFLSIHSPAHSSFPFIPLPILPFRAAT
jgi:hypothetical protein